MANLHNSLSFTLLIMSLTACVSSHFSADVVEQVNTQKERQDLGLEPHRPDPYHEQVLRLWRDKPDAVALQATKPKRFRIITAVAPRYPLMLRMGHVNGRVVVSFILGVDGRVEEARILESSDERFNDSALEAIQQFTFLPAEGPNGPERDLVHILFRFVWSAKAYARESTQPAGT
jgi:TonB family protein